MILSSRIGFYELQKVNTQLCTPSAQVVHTCHRAILPNATTVLTLFRGGFRMADNKTQETQIDPMDFIAGLDHPTRKADAITGYYNYTGPT